MAIPNSIYGLFPGPHSAERGMNALRDAGVPKDKIVVMASEPFEEYSFAQGEQTSIMGWIAVGGGVLGGITGFSIAWIAQSVYPLVTGGMPILAPWPTGIVTYEVTMMGAVLVTVIALLIGGRIPDWSQKLYDPEISYGKVLIGVIDPSDESRASLEERLRRAGAEKIKATGRFAFH
jgi:Alternative complex III, ActD subunit